MADAVPPNEVSAEIERKVVPVNGIPTVISVLQPKDKPSKLSVVVIPGNPGLVEYYDVFISSLYEASGQSLSIYGISHAGHSPILAEYTKHLENHERENSPLLTEKNNVDETEVVQSCCISTGTYSLQEQITHKKAFLEKYIPKNTKIILIGHSIGAYIILKLMKEITREPDIVKAILLFPTIERMAASPNGRYVTPFVNYFKWLAVSTVSFVSYFPQSFMKSLVQWWFSGRCVQDDVVDTTLRLLSSEASSNSLEMARCEMAEVTELDEDVIASHLDKLIFYYGATDQWAPVSYYEDLKKKFPDGEIYLCDKGFEHAFVLTSSTQVGQMVWQWLDKIQSHYS
ncbi:lipid droplet-associated hydrolase [Exaiptasia diaphana]|uniref:Lipid droplet-associated hydrolase n=1 Tax=Exaiptasia diaphana TaxID=2652724 RepID=A0A913WXC3_EXADI|nr:lipid droplet-associated hydrolase [Exaiptasia diaphana]